MTDPRGALATMKGRPVDEVVEELYLRTVSRYPDAGEKKLIKPTEKGLEDLFWALLNSKEFLYNH